MKQNAADSANGILTALVTILILLQVVRVHSDGELNTPNPPVTVSSNITDYGAIQGCNPSSLSYKYYRISNGGPVYCSKCRCTWDLFEFQARSQGIAQTFTVHSDAGHSGSHRASNIIDGNTGSYWYGGHALGDLGHQCWSTAKVGLQWIVLQAREPYRPLTTLIFHQGGDSNCCKVSIAHLECAMQLGAWTPKRSITISSQRTQVEFSASGMRTTDFTGGIAALASRQLSMAKAAFTLVLVIHMLL